MLTVEVAYAKKDEQRIIEIQVPEGCTIRQAIEQSQMNVFFPDIDITTCKVGVFGVIKALDERLLGGERIEIYRPLTMHPMEVRRLKAKNTPKK